MINKQILKSDDVRLDVVKASGFCTTSYKTAFINSLAVTYNFTNDLWVKLICQNNTSNDKFYVYGLFGWRFKPPFGNLYFIINHNEYMDQAGQFQNKNIGYLKLTYPIMIR